MPTTTANATKTASAFRLAYSVEIDIRATPSRVWSLLTDAGGMPRWNTTVSEVRGTIAAGERLAIQVPVAPGRTFKPRVTALEPERAMTWSDGFAPMFRGERTFTLTDAGAGVTRFTMTEVFQGAMLPLIKRALPDFVPVFETYATDLQRAAEGSA